MGSVISHQQKEGSVVSVTVMCLWPPCAIALKLEPSSVCPFLGSDKRTETQSEFIIPVGPVSNSAALNFASALCIGTSSDTVFGILCWGPDKQRTLLMHLSKTATNSFVKIFIVIFLFVCMCVSVPGGYGYPQRPGEGVGSPGTN